MTSFKRRAPSVQTPLPPGAKQCPGVPSIMHVSSGISSLDDILGGGIPLGCILTLLSPDPHSAWGDLIQRYFISEGLLSDQGVCVMGGGVEDLVKGCMWTQNTDDSLSNKPEDASRIEDGEIKIAWRYEKMRQFQTTVPDRSPSSSEEYCHAFDLTRQIPEPVLAKASENGQLTSIDISAIEGGHGLFVHLLSQIHELLQGAGYTATGDADSTRNSLPRRALRLSIPQLAGPAWGDSSGPDILWFIYSLRAMIRNTSVAVLITLPPHLSTRSPQLSGDGDADDHWIDKLGYLSDGCITLSSFGGDPSLADLFQTYHGAVHIHSSPSPHAMLPPSHKHSVLRGLASSSNQVGGGGENNLAFRCTRKRFIIETLHLDVEGGVGERRTTAPPGGLETPKPNAGSAGHGSSTQATAPAHPAAEEKPGKQKKRVAFQADRPELYDF